MNIKDYKNIDQLKKMSKKDLIELAQSIRETLIDLSKKKRIHLSSNLGIVELTISLLKNFDLPNDKINYDIGHQCYVHKILTDRKDKISTIREYNGLSGFPDNNESIYDFISTGHSSNSLSISQGYIETKKNNYNLITVIGDASISNGLSLEAINNISYNRTKMIIVLNDNEMSISKNTGGFFKIFSKMKNTNFYFGTESLVINILKKTKFGRKICKFFFDLLNKIEKLFFGKNIFHCFDLHYIGPIDGHNLKKLDKAFQRAKWYVNDGPVILHVKTKKGKGLENNNDPKYHSIKLGIKEKNDSFSYFVSQKLYEICKQYDDVKIINSAMTHSTNLDLLQKEFPNKYEDVGINEEHSISKASGIAYNKIKTFVMLYSTFLQRTYDQILHDVARLKLPIIFLIDRADIAYSDGDTHHGIYDVGMIKSIPNTIITMPSNNNELNELIDLAIKNKENPFFIRYPNTNAVYENINPEKIEFGKWKVIKEQKNNKICIISYGPYINKIYENFTHKNVDIINAIFLTFYDESYVIDLLKKYKKIIFYERIYKNGALYNDIVSLLNRNNIHIECKLLCFQKSNIGIGDEQRINQNEKMRLEDIEKEL